MATNETSTGLLSKMAKFVRHPTRDWSELDKPESALDSGYSKQALKEMIERKRQNDFVRRREFDYLRKLRSTGHSVSADSAGRPSFFESSTPSNLDERATTLKKIDEIEAHMSKQWWRGKQQGGSVQGALPLEVDRLASASELAAQSAEADTVPEHADSDYASTKMGMSSSEGLAMELDFHQARSAKNKDGRNSEAASSEFSASNLFSYALGESLADPELEEAAIRFANGDDAGAEAGLLAALQADNVNPDLTAGWASALFDLFRATGQQARFDSFAIDYALRFGRSAPAWFSIPELLGLKSSAAEAGHESTVQPSGYTLWEAPGQLDLPALQSLLDQTRNTDLPLHLNWQRLTAISAEAAQGLGALFSEWCAKSVRLHFAASDVLEKVLKSMTPSGDRQVEVVWWKLRLNVLRMLRLQDEFELVALDFCVTYEVSPPPWVDPRCECGQGSTHGAVLSARMPPLFNDVETGDPVDFDHASTQLMSIDSIPASVVELSGEVLGDALEAMDKLQVGLTGSNRLVISCSRLIRVDFSAAGSILNWVAVRQSDGCHVQFRDVPSLVAAFFNVIGINEHARVISRTH